MLLSHNLRLRLDGGRRSSLDDTGSGVDSEAEGIVSQSALSLRKHDAKVVSTTHLGVKLAHQPRTRACCDRRVFASYEPRVMAAAASFGSILAEAEKTLSPPPLRVAALCAFSSRLRVQVDDAYP